MDDGWDDEARLAVARGGGQLRKAPDDPWWPVLVLIALGAWGWIGWQWWTAR